jgi:hypothetical protein
MLVSIVVNKKEEHNTSKRGYRKLWFKYPSQGEIFERFVSFFFEREKLSEFTYG